MKIVHGFDKKLSPDRVVTIGTFDGVHTGHLKILQTLRAEAEKHGAVSTVLTFEPHPRVVLARSGKAPGVRLLTTFDEKMALLAAQKVDDVVVIRFDEAFSQLSYKAFFEKYIVSQMRLKSLVVGHDHAFGRDRQGNFDAIDALSKTQHFDVVRVDAFHLDGVAVSSSKIRRLLAEGRVAEARPLLGYAYGLSGVVVPGDARGRLLNFPTANVKPDNPDKLIPREGVYAVDVLHKEDTYKGMMNIGYRPTFNKNAFALEVHILEFSETIYGDTLTIRFKKRLRDEKKFASKEALIEQLNIDRKQSLIL